MPRRVDMRRTVLLRRSDPLQYEHERAARRADIDRLIAGVQHQHRLIQSIGTYHRSCSYTPGSALSDGVPAPAASCAHTRRSARATVKTVTDAAPARFRTLAQALAVAPVVRTSSTTRTRRPATASRLRTSKTLATFARRCAAVRPACGVVAFRLKTTSRTGIPVRRDSA